VVTLDVLVPTSGRPGALAVTLTSLACSTVRDLRLVVSDQSDGAPSYDDPVVRGVLRVLEHHGTRVELHRHLPRRGMAEQREFLLQQATADRVLFLDDDLLLEPDAVATLMEAMGTTGAGFVAMAMQGLSFLADERPHEHVAYEEWDGPVVPERVRKDTPGWDRWRLHNAANLVHLDRRLGPHPRGWRAYRVAWAAGCVLFDRRALIEAGGFAFWPDLPPQSAGEDVVAQLRVMERSGGAGVLPSGAWHLELPTSVGDRRVDAYAVVLGNPPAERDRGLASAP
jgi:GT2 family glycosyltransferase